MGYLLAYTPYTTNLFLQARGNSINAIIASFKARVAADGGTYEAESCQLAQLNALNAIP